MRCFFVESFMETPDRRCRGPGPARRVRPGAGARSGRVRRGRAGVGSLRARDRRRAARRGDGPARVAGGLARQEAQRRLGRRGRHRRRHRQAAGQERRRRHPARAGRQHRVVGRRRRRLLRERPRQHPRHQPQPDADADQRPRGGLRRLVHPRPAGRRRPQRQLLAAAVGDRQLGHRRQEPDGRPARRRRVRLGQHRDAPAARLHEAADARGLRAGDLRRPRRRRPTRSSTRWSTGRTTPTTWACCCRCSPRRATSAATASRPSATAPSTRPAPAATAHPDLANVLVPYGVNSALFEQTRKRVGGLLDLEFKPTSTLTLDANGFYSTLNASNYNRSFYSQPASIDRGRGARHLHRQEQHAGRRQLLARGGRGRHRQQRPGQPVPGGRRRGRPALSAQRRRARPTTATSTPSGARTDTLTFAGDLGYTHGVGKTPSEYGYSAAIGLDGNVGMNYALHGMGAPDLSFPGADVSNFNTSAATEGGSHDRVFTYDAEKYGTRRRRLGARPGRVRVGQVRRALRRAHAPHRLADQRQLPGRRLRLHRRRAQAGVVRRHLSRQLRLGLRCGQRHADQRVAAQPGRRRGLGQAVRQRRRLREHRELAGRIQRQGKGRRRLRHGQPGRLALARQRRPAPRAHASGVAVQHLHRRDRSRAWATRTACTRRRSSSTTSPTSCRAPTSSST